jgi:hypothetical protein
MVRIYHLIDFVFEEYSTFIILLKLIEMYIFLIFILL